jgi:hypothetical protein
VIKLSPALKRLALNPSATWASWPEATAPLPWMNPLAGRPPSSLAFRFGTRTLLLTFSGGDLAAADRLSAVPLVFASDAIFVAVLGLPGKKVPPVAATAVPDRAKNNAISETTRAADGRAGAVLAEHRNEALFTTGP